MCNRVKSGRLPFPLRAERLIQEILARCVVDVSVHMGLGIEPFIDLDSKGKGNFKNLPSVSVNEFGITICPKGYTMCFCGFNKSRSRLKWRCPLKAGSRRLRKNISCDCPCSNSFYGHTVYTKPQDDLRIFTRTPRDSKPWRKVYVMRSSSERSFKRIKIDYEIEHSRVRSRKSLQCRSAFRGCNSLLVVERVFI